VGSSLLGILSTKLGGGTTRMSGTSMATPHVAGIVALALQAHPALTPAGVRALVTGTASRIGIAPLNSPVNGYTYDGVREGIASAPGVIAP
jgi:subtilisin family serine protease